MSEEEAKQIKTLEEDDEFEDFPVENWTSEQSISKEQQDHLWDEDWDDDDNSDDFTQSLKEELKKCEGVANNVTAQ